MPEHSRKVRIPGLPAYSTVRYLLTILDGVPKVAVADMVDAILEQKGTPQSTVDWSEPDRWIVERLTGEHAKLARHIWEASEGHVNPRYLRNPLMFINSHRLMDIAADDTYHLAQRGSLFLHDDQTLIRDIDDAEGLLQLLTILGTRMHARRADLLPEWISFLKQYSNFASPSTFKGTLRHRMGNLIERGLVEREGQSSYTITTAGREYLAVSPPLPDPKHDVIQAISAFNERQRQLLKERLSTLDPYRFEHLVRELLEAMGYDDVQVTKPSGDKGVDVVATIQFGITLITEVVQVKRHQGTITRQVLDQLRGALPYHKAIRGTIITTGSFSAGCKEGALFPGAAPIGLIDGDRLLNLLVEHKIGLKEQPATLYEIDEEFFDEPSVSAIPIDDIDDV